MNVTKLIDDGYKIGMLQHKEEIIGLTSFLAGIQPYNILEIGSWKGGLFNILCNICPPEALKVSIDLDAYGDLEGTIEQRNDMMKSWAPNVHTIIGSSHNAKIKQQVQQALGDRMFDFIMIDGDHSYEGCKLDWEMYGPMGCGWIAFHDIVDSERHKNGGCFVHQVWEDLQSLPYQKIEISLGKEWGGIGLIRR